tara:strand:- start:353 stop:568 length:216 start_codon:yes stop_codon:yes gene_type:complete
MDQPTEEIGRPYGATLVDVLFCVWCWSVLTRPPPQTVIVRRRPGFGAGPYADLPEETTLPPLTTLNMQIQR